MKYYTITQDDVGQSHVVFNGTRESTDFMGGIQPGDVGKRIFRVPTGSDTDPALGAYILMVENDEQLKQRTRVSCQFCEGVWSSYDILLGKMQSIDNVRDYMSRAIVGPSGAEAHLRERKVALQDAAAELYRHAKDHERKGHPEKKS